MHDAGFGNVIGPADDRPPIGEDRNPVLFNLQPQQERIHGNFPDRLKFRRKLGERSRLAAGRRKLHGVAAAERNRRGAAAAFEPRKIALDAGAAARFLDGARDADRAELVVPEVDHRQSPADRLAMAAQDFQRLGRLQGGDRRDDRPDDAGRFARWLKFRRRRLGEEAAEARRLARQDGEHLPLGADAAAEDPRDVVRHGEIVEQVARLEIVGAVDDAINAVRPGDRCSPLSRRRLRLRSSTSELICRSRRAAATAFGNSSATSRFVEENLAMEVVAFEKVAIDDPHMPDAGPDELIGDDAAQGAATANERSGRQQSTLPFFAERSEIASGGGSDRVAGQNGSWKCCRCRGLKEENRQGRQDAEERRGV